jgi:formylglycine-generating enzyme required for sulfatase activity
VAAPAAKPLPAPAPSIYEAAQAWAAARETKNPAVLEEFLGRFSDTIYGSMARDRLQQLKNTEVAVVAPAVPAKPPTAAAPAAAAAPAGRTPAPPAVSPAVGVFSTARPATPLSAAEEHALKPKDGFTECAHCPEMVVIPAGNFLMGSPTGEEGRMTNEGPQSAVKFARPFAAGKYAVSFEEWDACVDAGGCNGYRPSDEGRSRERNPVVNVSWEDAQAYVAWLSKATGKSYRLLSEAEREYATRAGTTTPFWWGASISTKQANYDGTVSYGGGEKGEYRQRTLPVDSFAANALGLHQVHGNVNEWMEDCWRTGYQQTASDGSASTTGDCGRRVLRGGSWYDGPQLLRSAARLGFYPAYRSNKIGFRVAREL